MSNEPPSYDWSYAEDWPLVKSPGIQIITILRFMMARDPASVLDHEWEVLDFGLGTYSGIDYPIPMGKWVRMSGRNAVALAAYGLFDDEFTVRRLTNGVPDLDFNGDCCAADHFRFGDLSWVAPFEELVAGCHQECGWA